VVNEWWIDDDPESPDLLARKWSIAGEWVAGWLDAHPSGGGERVRAALADLDPSGAGEYHSLDAEAFLVIAPSSIGNVFIVAKSDGHYRLAWNIGQTQQIEGKQAEILAAWRPENARLGRRGPYFAASGSAGSVMPRVGSLPNDAKGNPRFYIDGTYAQSAGGTVGAQISLWVWTGKTAKPLIARNYYFMIDQAVGTRVEGNLLIVQQKRFFRTFSSCGGCEERQTDWIVRLTPDGFEDLGEKSAVPELDAVDELFYRVVRQQSAVDVAAHGAIKTAEKIVDAARTGRSEAKWKEYPTLGMMMAWNIQKSGQNKVLCLSLLDAGTNLFTLESTGGKLFITHVSKTVEDCRN
jgi:hypothetical protein